MSDTRYISTRGEAPELGFEDGELGELMEELEDRLKMVPVKRRPALIRALEEHDGPAVFLSTDAGGVGLNLQNAAVLINLDIPWNPAVLDQRIARVHRLGQRQKVQAILLEDQPVVPLFFYVSRRVVKSWVKGWDNSLLDYHPTRHMYIDASSDGV